MRFDNTSALQFHRFNYFLVFKGLTLTLTLTTNTEEMKLDVFDNRCLRRILGIKWFHRVRNTAVREWTGQTPASLFLKTRRLRWFGHVSRMGQEGLPKPYRNGDLRMQSAEEGKWSKTSRNGSGFGVNGSWLEAQWRDMLALLVS